MDYYSEVTDNFWERTDELLEMHSDFEKLIKESNIDGAAVKFGEIVKLSTDINAEPEDVEEAAKMLGDYIKNSGIYKNRILMEKLSKLKLVPKILLARQFVTSFSTSFPIEAMFTKPSFKGRQRIGTEKWIKKTLPFPMALGLNQHGKLGNSKGNSTEEFRRVHLNGLISAAFIGEKHTIICTKDGKYFGTGCTGNFSIEKDPKDTTIPVELNYIKHKWEDWHGRDPMCYLTENSTVFSNFRQTTMFTTRKKLVMERTENEGTIWKEVDTDGMPPVQVVDLEADDDFVSERHQKRITINNSKGIPTTVAIDALYLSYRALSCSRAITWFICGARIQTEKIRGFVHFGEDGIVWIHHQETLYRGELVFAPRVLEASELVDSESDSEYEEEEKIERKEKKEKIKLEEVLVANMEEVNFPYAIHGFAVSADGKSVMIWPNAVNTVESELETPQKMIMNKIPRSWEFSSHVHRTAPFGLQMRFEDIYETFLGCINNFWPGKLLTYSGFPSIFGQSVIQQMNDLREYIQFKDFTNNRPLGLYQLMYKRNEIGGRVFDPSRQGGGNWREIYPVSVKAGWSDDEREERIEQMKEKETELLAEVVQEIEKALGSLSSIPLEHRQSDFDGLFKEQMAKCMRQIMSNNIDYVNTDVLRGIVVEEVKSCVMGVKNVGKAVKERIQQNDIDGTDERFQLIRVEAVGYHVEKSVVHHCPYVVYTTRHHINIVENLLLHFIKDDVLNLNRSFKILPYETEFPELMDTFFGLMPENEYKLPFRFHLTRHPSGEVDFYFITTNDSYLVKVPKILFQVHSAGYNAMRIREAARTGQDPDNFEMDVSRKTLELLMKALIDSRELKNCDLNSLTELLEFCRYALFTVLHPQLIKRILMKAEEKDSKILQDLFFYHPEETINFVSEHRPEILHSWKEFPMRSNYLRTLREVVNKIYHLHYKLIKKSCGYVENRPFPLTEDRRIEESQKIKGDWLRNFLLNDGKDEDVKENLEKSIEIWDGTKPIKRKRSHSYS